MYTICSSFAICSFRGVGTGPFPSRLVPFENEGWSLLDLAGNYLGLADNVAFPKVKFAGRAKNRG